MATITSTNSFAVKVIAHRGASGHAPENTIASIKAAIEMSVEFVEVDVHMSTDHEIFVFHDDTLARTTNGKGKIKDQDSKYLKTLDAGSWFDPKYSNEKIPTLLDILSLDFKKSKLIIEVKNVDNIYAGIEKKIHSIVQASAFQSKIVYKSFSTEVLERFHHFAPTYDKLYVTVGSFLGFLVIDDWLRIGSIFDLDFVKYIQVHRHFISKSLVEKAKKNGKIIIVWDVHKKEHIKTMKDLGVDYIETDYPKRVKD
jgi:glycerophosphoryl diester phosphodiesterase